MLLELRLQNFLLADNIHLEFTKGLNILTGETGAGKSIILNAINSLTKSRLSTDLVKKNKKQAYIEGSFYKNADINQWLTDNDFESDEDTFTISRELSEKGSKARIDGKIIQTKLLNELADKLCEIHMQNSQDEIFSTRSQVDFIDSFLTDDLYPLSESYRGIYKEWKKLTTELESRQEKSSSVIRELDYLKFQFEELDAAGIEDPEEEDKLKQEIQKSANAESINKGVQSIYGLVHGSEVNLSGHFHKAMKDLSHATQYDSELNEHTEELIAAYENLIEVSRELISYGDSLSTHANIDSLNKRVSEIQKLRRKHNVLDLAELIEFKNNIEDQIHELENFSDNLEDLIQRANKLEAQLHTIAKQLHGGRLTAAVQLSEQLTSQLPELGMDGAELNITVTQQEKLNSYGSDKIEFMFRANAGQDANPVSKVASGGEKSRITLLLKSAAAATNKSKQEEKETLIFDEIDTGTSGKVTEMIGEKLNALSKNNQIICVTHQPLVACYADKHFMVSKHNESDNTILNINLLEKESEKVKALLDLMTGQSDKESAEKFITGLREKAQKEKSEQYA